MCSLRRVAGMGVSSRSPWKETKCLGSMMAILRWVSPHELMFALDFSCDFKERVLDGFGAMSSSVMCAVVCQSPVPSDLLLFGINAPLHGHDHRYLTLPVAWAGSQCPMKVRPHKKFTRVNDDLHYDMKISMKEALLGFQR